jgi:hypothetical protein
MKLVKLETKEQFEQLKKGDIVMVQWRPNSREYKKGTPITVNKIWGINHSNELILNHRTNSYFDIDLYLRGESYALEVCIIEESSSQNIRRERDGFEGYEDIHSRDTERVDEPHAVGRHKHLER